MFDNDNSGSYNYFHENDDDVNVWYEVVGNIYQNKELLGEYNE